MPFAIKKTGKTEGAVPDGRARFWKSHHSHDMSLQRLGQSGIPLDIRDNQVVTSDPEKHCMVCGTSGRGKTRRELYPMVVMSARASRSMVIADMKGEIYRNTADEVRRCGHQIRVINLRNPSVGNRYNPLSLVQRYWDEGNTGRATIMLKDITNLLTQKIRSDKDGFWQSATEDVIVGFALFILEHKLPLTFDSIHRLCTQYFSDDDTNILREMFDTGTESYRRLSTILNLISIQTSSCISSEVNAVLSCFVDQSDVRDLLSSSDFDLTDIGRQPMAVYLVCPDESTALYDIASQFVEQCYSELISFADSREDNTLPVKVDFLLDEFGSFVGSDWPSKLTAARSRGIRFVLALQNMSQLMSRYGENGARTIMANCRTLVFMGGRDIDLMQEICTLGGSTTDSRTRKEQPVLTLPRLSMLQTGEVVVIDDGSQPYIGTLPDWSAWNISTRSRLSERKREPSGTSDISLVDILSRDMAARGKDKGEIPKDSPESGPEKDELNESPKEVPWYLDVQEEEDPEEPELEPDETAKEVRNEGHADI